MPSQRKDSNTRPRVDDRSEYEKAVNPIGGKTKITDDIFQELTDYMRFKPKLADCAGRFKVGRETIETAISQRTGLTFREFRDENMHSVRTALAAAAMDEALGPNLKARDKGRGPRNPTMLIYLCKSLNGWSDRPEDNVWDEITGIEFSG